VAPRPDDPRQRQRQATYVLALRTIAGLEVHYGTFLRSRTRMRLAQPTEGGPRTAEPIRIVRQRFRRPVVIACPHRRCALELQRAASLVKYIRRSALERSQLPPVVQDRYGTVTKPPGW